MDFLICVALLISSSFALRALDCSGLEDGDECEEFGCSWFEDSWGDNEVCSRGFNLVEPTVSCLIGSKDECLKAAQNAGKTSVTDQRGSMSTIQGCSEQGGKYFWYADVVSDSRAYDMAKSIGVRSVCYKGDAPTDPCDEFKSCGDCTGSRWPPCMWFEGYGCSLTDTDSFRSNNPGAAPTWDCESGETGVGGGMCEPDSECKGCTHVNYGEWFPFDPTLDEACAAVNGKCKSGYGECARRVANRQEIAIAKENKRLKTANKALLHALKAFAP